MVDHRRHPSIVTLFCFTRLTDDNVLGVAVHLACPHARPFFQLPEEKRLGRA
jgi:hypothetical protein